MYFISWLKPIASVPVRFKSASCCKSSSTKTDPFLLRIS
jgi:hypothetical protein